MKRIVTTLTFVFLSITFIISQTIIPAGDVSGTWTLQNSPYLIEGEILIPEDSLLTIEPGVFVEFQGHYRFKVHGKILAIGQLSDTITFTINDTTGFSNFATPDGGWHGLRFQNELSSDTSILSFCKFEYGKAIGIGHENNYGGAIFAEDYSALFISNCMIKNNYAEQCGGGMYDRFTFIRIKLSSFINNHADWIGGGLFTGESLIVNCKFENNYGYYDGGGIVWDGYSPILVSNLIANNTTEYNGGGIACVDDFGSTLINNTICNNSAQYGGGGFSITGVFGNLKFINNIIYGNLAGSGNQIYGVGGVDSIEFRHCNIEGGYEAFGGDPFQGVYVGNIDSDPIFLNSGEHPYNLSPESPCIDTGIVDTSGLSLPIFDLAGNPRIYNNRIDIGAYEFYTTGLSKQMRDSSSSIVYPNPSTGMFWVKLNSNFLETVSIDIFNSYGEKLKTLESNKMLNPIDLSDSPKGIYLIKTKIGSEDFTQKIIIQ